MTAEIRFHRITTVLLTAALLATLTVALTGGHPADAVDGPVDLVYVATGRDFPDALAGANLAATTGAPMLTVERDLPIPDATVAALQALDPNRIVIFGGPAAVSDAVRGALADYARSGSVTRIEGLDRHATAAAIAEALPDKVHDADRLDGLDSSAFARTSALPGVQTVTEHVSCSGTGFFPIRSATSYGSIGNTGRFVTGTDTIVTCPVSPPDGARLVSATFAVTDISASASIDYVQLVRFDLAGFDPQLLASAQDVTGETEAPGAVQVTAQVDSGLSGAVVDTGTSLYELRVRLDASANTGDHVAVYGASMAYKIDRVSG